MSNEKTIDPEVNAVGLHIRENKSGIIGRWLESLDKGNRKIFYISYCVFFLVMFACMYASFFLAGRTFIWIDDGLTQQYTVFVEFGDWVRQLLSNVFITHTFEIPMWSQELGYGQDYLILISSLLGNPINWIAVFSDVYSAEFLLNLTVPVTLFLAGLAFTRLAFYHGDNQFAILLGAMIYVFSGSTIVAFNQIFLIYPMVLAPIVFLGVDKIVDSRSPVLFIVSIALAGLYSLYNTWMICILLLVYCVIRFVFLPDKSLKLFGKLFIKIFLSLLLGTAMSAVLFIPVAEGILSLGRVGLERSWNLFYSLSYYPEVISGFLKFAYAGSECFIGALSLSVVAVVALFVSKRNTYGKVLLTLFIVLTIFLLLPFFGKIMNGFAYPNNRWIWMYALVMGMISTYVIPKLCNLNLQDMKKCTIALTLAMIFFMIFGMFSDKFYYIILILFVGTALCVLALKGNMQRMSMILSLILSCGLLFGSWGNAAASRNVPIGQSLNMATSGGNAVAMELEGSDWRFDSLGIASSYRNASTVTDKNGTTFYNSMYNGAIDDYQTELGLATSPLNFSTESMNGRTIMEQFAGVRYVMTSDAQGFLAPAIYDEIVLKDNVNGVNIEAHEADKVLPLAFLQNNTISESEFRELSPVAAQEALLQAAVIADSPTTVDIQQYNKDLEFSFQVEIIEEDPKPLEGKAPELVTTSTVVEDSAASEVEGYEFTTQNSAKFHLNVDIPANEEAYLILEDVGFDPMGVITSTSSFIDRQAVRLQGIFPLADNGCQIVVSTEDRASGVWQTGKDAHLYSGKSTWAFCLGTADHDRSGIDVAFSNAGNYRIGSMSVCVEDVATIENEIYKLCDQGANDIEFSGNTLTCSVNVEDPEETLVIRLPYSAGWSAVVDGRSVDVENVDIGFMGIKLASGIHDVKLTYQTPGLTIGAVVSLLGLLCFGVVLFVLRKRRKLQPTKDETE